VLWRVLFRSSLAASATTIHRQEQTVAAVRRLHTPYPSPEQTPRTRNGRPRAGCSRTVIKTFDLGV